MATGQFRSPKTEKDEIALLSETVPKNTKYNTKLAVNAFTTWQGSWKQMEEENLSRPM